MLDADNQIDHSFHICYTKEAEFLIVGMILSFGFAYYWVGKNIFYHNGGG